nr:hypothetical protein [Tanacetum cinerariifolium]
MSKPDVLVIKSFGNLTMVDEEISIILAREIKKFKTSYASDLPIPRESEVNASSVDEPFNTLSMGDMEIEFNPFKDIYELERLLVDDHIPIPRESEDSISGVDHICDSSNVAINSPEFEIVTAFLIVKTKICLREVERSKTFLSLTWSEMESKNDTTITDVDVLKNEAIVADLHAPRIQSDDVIVISSDDEDDDIIVISSDNEDDEVIVISSDDRDDIASTTI